MQVLLGWCYLITGHFLPVIVFYVSVFCDILFPSRTLFVHYVNMSQSSNQQNIKVVVRVRPLSNDERGRVKEVVHCISMHEIQAKEKTYYFDRVFPPNSSQMDIYSFVVAPMIIDVLSGYNCTVFAYGQTGTGKTHTMTGGDLNSSHIHGKDNELAGCIPRAAANIFNGIGSMKVTDYNVRVSFLELYNEEVRDLLGTEYRSVPLSMFNDNKGSVYIQDLNEITVFNSKDIYELLEQGTLKRQTAATLMNDHSSRSHTVFTITVHTREMTLSGEEVLKSGKINLVDLAGSENIAKTGATDKRAQELVNINRSLLTLGRVIQILAERNNKHVPYRESKLTRILQASLGGHTKTCIIATVSPAHTSLEETQSTLEYACRARDIKNTPMVNEKVTKTQMMKEMTAEIDKLKRELDAARTGTGFFVDRSNWEELTLQVEETSNTLTQKNDIIENLKSKLLELETVRDIKEKEYEEAMNVCNHKEKIIEKARSLLKEQSNSLKQERYLSDCYLEAARANQSTASKLLETSNSLSKKQEILQEKLENQYVNNTKNEQLVNEKGSIFSNNLNLAMMAVQNIGCTVNSNATTQKQHLETARSTCTDYSVKSEMTWANKHRPEIETVFGRHAELVQDRLKKLKEGIQSELQVSQVLGFIEKSIKAGNTAREEFEKCDQRNRDSFNDLLDGLTSRLLHSRAKMVSRSPAPKRFQKDAEDSLKDLDNLISCVEGIKAEWSTEATELDNRKHTIITNMEKVHQFHQWAYKTLESCRDGLQRQIRACCEVESKLLIDNQNNRDIVERIMCNKQNEESSVISTNLLHLNALEEQISNLHQSLESSLSDLKIVFHRSEDVQKDTISNIIPVKRTGSTPKQVCLNYPKRLEETTLSRDSLLKRFEEFNEDIGNESFHLHGLTFQPLEDSEGSENSTIEEQCESPK